MRHTASAPRPPDLLLARSELLGWAPAIALPLAGALLPWEPAWGYMWTLAFSIFFGCKWLTWFAAPERGTVARQLAYLFIWPGLDAPRFLTSTSAVAPRVSEWLRGSRNIASGTLLLFVAARWMPQSAPYLVGSVGMVGIVLVLHFGALHLVSCAWRAVGLRAEPLMLAPILSTSITEFWGRRWNTAFRDLTHRFLFRPLCRRLSARSAVLVSFLFSGLIHELAISVPAGAGYGGPTLFFVVQGIAILFERSRTGRALLSTSARRRLFTWIVLVAPFPVLFHPPFVTTVVVPFLTAIGAIS